MTWLNGQNQDHLYGILRHIYLVQRSNITLEYSFTSNNNVLFVVTMPDVLPTLQ